MLENKTASRAFPTLHVGAWRRWRHYPSRKGASCWDLLALTPPKTPSGGQLQHRELCCLPPAVVRSTLPKLRSLPRTLQRDSRSDPSADLDSLAGLDERRGGGAEGVGTSSEGRGRSCRAQSRLPTLQGTQSRR